MITIYPAFLKINLDWPNLLTFNFTTTYKWRNLIRAGDPHFVKRKRVRERGIGFVFRIDHERARAENYALSNFGSSAQSSNPNFRRVKSVSHLVRGSSNSNPIVLGYSNLFEAVRYIQLQSPQGRMPRAIKVFVPMWGRIQYGSSPERLSIQKAWKYMNWLVHIKWRPGGVT